MNRIEKPLTQYFNEFYKEEFSGIICDNIPKGDEMLKDTIMVLIQQAYKEGFSDGASLALWSKDI